LFLIKYNLVTTIFDGCAYYSTLDPCLFVTILVDDGMACNIKEDSIEHILSFMGDAFKITTSYPEVYVELRIIQVREECLIQIDQTQYMFFKLKKYGYENYIPVVTPTDLNNVSNLSMHTGDGSIKDQ
jgi:hypothetical protein